MLYLTAALHTDFSVCAKRADDKTQTELLSLTYHSAILTVASLILHVCTTAHNAYVKTSDDGVAKIYSEADILPVMYWYQFTAHS